MKTFKCLKFRPHLIEGICARMNFKNGYGISVIGASRLWYCDNGTYEVAVLKNGTICYDTPITDNVLGWQTPDDVTRIMKQIQEL